MFVRLLVCLNWAFNIPDYHLFAVSKHWELFFVQVTLHLKERKASLKWRRQVKPLKLDDRFRRSAMLETYLALFLKLPVLNLGGEPAEIKKLPSSLRTCSNVPSAPRSLTAALILGVKGYSEERKKKEGSFKSCMGRQMPLPPPLWSCTF